MTDETPHVHRWRMETPTGPTVHGACACGATRKDPAVPTENWGLLSDRRVKEAMRKHAHGFHERGDDV